MLSCDHYYLRFAILHHSIVLLYSQNFSSSPLLLRTPSTLGLLRNKTSWSWSVRWKLQTEVRIAILTSKWGRNRNSRLSLRFSLNTKFVTRYFNGHGLFYAVPDWSMTSVIDIALNTVWSPSIIRNNSRQNPSGMCPSIYIPRGKPWPLQYCITSLITVSFARRHFVQLKS